MSSDLFRIRWQAVSARLVADGVDALVLSKGSDLLYLTGYPARSWERLTALVAFPGSDQRSRLFVPQIEVPLVDVRPDDYEITGWTDAQDPVEMVAGLLPDATRIVVSDDMWAIHLVRLMNLLPNATVVSLSDSLGGLRSVKTDAEVAAVQAAGGMVNTVAAQLQAGEIPLVGRTELEIAADIGERLIAVGHDTVEFCIVGSGPNSASAHHNPTERVVQPNEMVLCDFGGRAANGYCSDVTRCVWTGPIPDDVQATWDILKKAQQAAVDAARPGATLGDVDAAARDIITEAGFGANFIHRTGHGIGTEVHEQPYVTQGSDEVIVAGHAFSIEPGMYFNGTWGMRLEDIVVVADQGAIRCTTTSHEIIEVSV